MDQICTLRGHLNSISNIETFNDNIITGDDQGWIIWWNLNTRTPIGCWKGHDMAILTIKQIDDVTLLTHSKDSEIRIWQLDAEGEGGRILSKSLPDFKYNNLKYNDDVTELHEKFPLPKYNSIPINALNYCNVAYLNGILITPATVDSNNFDIYQLNHKDFGIDRLIKNFNPHELYLKTNHIISEIGNDKRDGFGIMMKIAFINDNNFYIGFESGHLLGFTITYPKSFDSSQGTHHHNERLIINKEPKITLDYFNDTHVPNPILSIEPMGDQVVVGSTQKKISVHKLGEVINVKTNGIQSIAIKDYIFIGFWNGLIKVYNKSFDQINKFERSLPNLQNITDNTANAQDLQESNIKLSTLKLFNPKRFNNDINKLSKKELVLNKRLTKKNLLVVGYNDGNLLIFEVRY